MTVDRAVQQCQVRLIPDLPAKKKQAIILNHAISYRPTRDIPSSSGARQGKTERK